MSRSALLHQEKNVQRRSHEAQEAWEQAVEQGRNNRARNLIPLFGSDEQWVFSFCGSSCVFFPLPHLNCLFCFSFQLEPMLLSNIKKSPYFVKICREVHDVNALIDQVYYDLEEGEKSIQPWALGKHLIFMGNNCLYFPRWFKLTNSIYCDSTLIGQVREQDQWNPLQSKRVGMAAEGKQ